MSPSIRDRLTTLRVSKEAENEEPQLQKKRGRLTTLRVATRLKMKNRNFKRKGAA